MGLFSQVTTTTRRHNFMVRVGARINRTCLIACCALSIIFSGALPSNAFATQSHPSAFKTGTVDTAAEQEFLSRTNSLRASLGLGALRTNSELLSKARSWSQTQANSGTIFHSTLTDGVTQNWHRLGENVGMGPDAAAIHDALVRSPRHYENLADRGFTDVGIGVVRQGNTIYVTEVFMEFMPATSNQPTHQNTVTTAPRAQSTGRPSGTKTHTPVTPTTTTTPVAQNVPLKTASPELNAVIAKLSALES